MVDWSLVLGHRAHARRPRDRGTAAQGTRGMAWRPQKSCRVWDSDVDRRPNTRPEAARLLSAPVSLATQYTRWGGTPGCRTPIISRAALARLAIGLHQRQLNVHFLDSDPGSLYCILIHLLCPRPQERWLGLESEQLRV